MPVRITAISYHSGKATTFSPRVLSCSTLSSALSIRELGRAYPQGLSQGWEIQTRMKLGVSLTGFFLQLLQDAFARYFCKHASADAPTHLAVNIAGARSEQTTRLHLYRTQSSKTIGAQMCSGSQDSRGFVAFRFKGLRGSPAQGFTMHYRFAFSCFVVCEGRTSRTSTQAGRRARHCSFATSGECNGSWPLKLVWRHQQGMSQIVLAELTRSSTQLPVFFPIRFGLELRQNRQVSAC